MIDGIWLIPIVVFTFAVGFIIGVMAERYDQMKNRLSKYEKNDHE